MHLVKCKPLQTHFGMQGLRGWREKGAPTHTYPDQREQSWASIYTCLPLGPQSNGSGGHFTQEKQIVEKNNINKKKEEGEMSKPFAFFYHSSQPNILYYNKVYSIHTVNKKHADLFFF